MSKDARPIHVRERSIGWEGLGARGVETETGHKEGKEEMYRLTRKNGERRQKTCMELRWGRNIDCEEDRQGLAKERQNERNSNREIS